MVIAGIVAGGSGTRMGSDLPKQFLELNGKPVLIYTAEQFLKHSDIDAVVIGINPEWEALARELTASHLPDCKRIFLTKGGSDRNETVNLMIRFARDRLNCSCNDIILTHDAVRPFVSAKIISDSIEAMTCYDICTAAVPETDTVVISGDGSFADSFPDRNTLFRVQTPQTFRIGTFSSVYEALTDEEKLLATDVCKLYKAKGFKIRLIEGDISNIKLTYPLDLRLAEAITCKEEPFSQSL